MKYREVRVEWQYDLTVKAKPYPTWRSRLAWLFRRIATGIDQAGTFTLTMSASHSVPRADRVAIMVAGFNHMKALYAERVKQEAIDEAMELNFPELRGDSQ